MARKSVSRWDCIVKESLEGKAIYVGVDVHKASYAVTLFSASGVFHTYTTPADNDGLIKQFQSNGISVKCLAYEAGPTGFGLYRACIKAGIDAMVVAACRVPRSPGNTAKTDRIDSLKLAQYLANGMLKPIGVPSEGQEAARTKVRRRNQLSKEIIRTKERIKSFLLVNSLAEPQGLRNWSGAGIERLQNVPMSRELRFTLGSYLCELKFLMAEKSLLEKDISKNVLPEQDVLQSVPGVGPITSSIFRAEIFDPKRFHRGEELSSFIGLAPMPRQSGVSSNTARLLPCGQGKLRSVLIESAWRLLSKETWAAEFYRRVLHSCGKAQKAIVALARKLAVVLWRLWQEERNYEPEYNPASVTTHTS